MSVFGTVSPIHDGHCGCMDCRKREGGTWWTDLKTREKWNGSLNPSAAATDFTVASLSNKIREACSIRRRVRN